MNTRILSNIVVFGVFFVLISFFWGAAFGELDRERYIGTDEIKEGMEAWCFTVLRGQEIERIPIEVLSVIKNDMPGRDTILVTSPDERFKHAGPIQGCSGSPVYIDGRLAGALAMSWRFSNDPIYVVTPIEYMLGIPEHKGGKAGGKGDDNDDGGVRRGGGSFVISEDWLSPIDLVGINEELMSDLSSDMGVSEHLLLTNFGDSARQDVAHLLEGLPFNVAGGSGSYIGIQDEMETEFRPGSMITLPLCGGDIALTVAGTVTEVREDEIYAFGHMFQGQGPLELPMGPGYVHSVIPNMSSSFKLASAGPAVGSIVLDQQSGVYGVVGRNAKTIPMEITVEHFADSEVRVYDCEVANHLRLTPLLVNIALTASATLKAELPHEHTIEYAGEIAVKGQDDIKYSNVSTQFFMSESAAEAASVLAVLLNNPFEEVEIESMEFKFKVLHKDSSARLRMVTAEDTAISPGDTVEVDTVARGYHMDTRRYRLKVGTERELAEGKYSLMVMGGREYLSYVMNKRPHRFSPEDIASLILSLNEILNFRRDRVYAVLELPAEGLTLRDSELPGLPGSKALLLVNEKRTLKPMPYQRFEVSGMASDFIIFGTDSVEIEVKDP
jgi:hypothetical protein